MSDNKPNPIGTPVCHKACPRNLVEGSWTRKPLGRTSYDQGRLVTQPVEVEIEVEDRGSIPALGFLWWTRISPY